MDDRILTYVSLIREQLLRYAPDAAHDRLAALDPLTLAVGVVTTAAFVLFTTLIAVTALFRRGRPESEPPEPFAARREGDGTVRTFARPRPLSDRSARSPQIALARRENQARIEAAEAEESRATYERLMLQGEQRFLSGQLRESLDHYRRALEAARRAAFVAQDDNAVQRYVARALHKVGEMHSALGDHAVARQQHEQALGLLRRLHMLTPESPEISRDMAVTLERLGVASAQSGDRQGARMAYEEELRIVRGLAAAEPGNVGWTRFEAVVHVMIGNLGEQDARTHYDRARVLLEQLEVAGRLQGTDQQTLAQLRQLFAAG